MPVFCRHFEGTVMSNILIHQSVHSIGHIRAVVRAMARGDRNSGWAIAIGRLRTWIERGHQRRALGDLAETCPDLLQDIGVTYAEAKREAEKPFWR
jgi:uncharacterized protein YjiS (DUF1127 family)